MLYRTCVCVRASTINQQQLVSTTVHALVLSLWPENPPTESPMALHFYSSKEAASILWSMMVVATRPSTAVILELTSVDDDVLRIDLCFIIDLGRIGLLKMGMTLLCFNHWYKDIYGLAMASWCIFITVMGIDSDAEACWSQKPRHQTHKTRRISQACLSDMGMGQSWCTLEWKI